MLDGELGKKLAVNALSIFFRNPEQLFPTKEEKELRKINRTLQDIHAYTQAGHSGENAEYVSQEEHFSALNRLLSISEMIFVTGYDKGYWEHPKTAEILDKKLRDRSLSVSIVVPDTIDTIFDNYDVRSRIMGGIYKVPFELNAGVTDFQEMIYKESFGSARPFAFFNTARRSMFRGEENVPYRAMFHINSFSDDFWHYTNKFEDWHFSLAYLSEEAKRILKLQKQSRKQTPSFIRH